MKKILLTLIFAIVFINSLSLNAGNKKLVPCGEPIVFQDSVTPNIQSLYERNGKIFLLAWLHYPLIYLGVDEGMGEPVYMPHYGYYATIFDTTQNKNIFEVTTVDKVDAINNANTTSIIPSAIHINENNEVVIASNQPKEFVYVAFRGYRFNITRYSLNINPDIKYTYTEEKDTTITDANGKPLKAVGTFAFYPAVYTGNEYVSAFNRYEEASPIVFSKHDKDGKLIDTAFINSYYYTIPVSDTTFLRQNFYTSNGRYDFIKNSYMYINTNAHEKIYKIENDVSGKYTRQYITSLLKATFAPEGNILWNYTVSTDSTYGINGNFKISEYDEMGGKKTCYAICDERYNDRKDTLDKYNNYYCISELDYDTGKETYYKSFTLSKSIGLYINSIYKTKTGDFDFIGYYDNSQVKFIGKLSTKGEILSVDTIATGNMETIVDYIYSDGKYYLISFKHDNITNTYNYQLYQLDATSSIIEPITITNSLLMPNPASDNCTLSMDLTEASNISISLSDMLGRNLMQIYDGYADVGTFTKKFDTKHLSSGIYSVVIKIGDKVKAEKLIIN